MADMALIPIADYQAAADQIRTLSGTESAIKSGEAAPMIEAANLEIDNQINKLESLIEQANALPDRNSSGGGTAETSTITLINNTDDDITVGAVTVSAGATMGMAFAETSAELMLYHSPGYGIKVLIDGFDPTMGTSEGVDNWFTFALGIGINTYVYAFAPDGIVPGSELTFEYAQEVTT